MSAGRTGGAEHDAFAVVIGTGLAGATVGYALARAGKRVLFVERGPSLLGPGSGLRGDFAESFFPEPAVPGAEHRDLLKRAGRCTDEIEDVSGPRPHRFIPFVGSGTGGSSALYGMVFERLFPSDFSPRANHPGASGSSLPDRWPISYADLLPWYEKAEALYRVRGTPDPCRQDAGVLAPPPELSEAGQELFSHLSARGLHPYRPPSACEYVTGCPGCQSFLCARGCKNDGVRIGLAPALEEHGARLLDACEVTRIEASSREVTGVVCSRHGRAITLSADVVVLAAGALESPRLLLKSSSPVWPRGLANSSGQVGKNLMRHFVDLYAVRTGHAVNGGRGTKEIALNDFYVSKHGKLGTFQSFGVLPPAPVLAADIVNDISRSARLLGALLGRMEPVLSGLLGRMLSGRTLLTSILEDLPYEDNAVLAPEGSGPLRYRYRVHDYDRARIAAFRRVIGETLRPRNVMVLKQAENNERIAHACGTCRFGLDPGTSVLDASNKAHDLSNLYVADASFFPSSGGTNPGLTIAANALRVADVILKGSAAA